MAQRLPNLRKALRAYDPAAKVVRSITSNGDGSHLVEYVDKENKTWTFTFREQSPLA